MKNENHQSYQLRELNMAEVREVNGGTTAQEAYDAGHAAGDAAEKVIGKAAMWIGIILLFV
ncbi:hypothetical protein [Prolixibacter sp. NT017]|jgi:hypothetical protein|uniref:hypothetical protein n=1 Tax=Prolixibacter sp. NT017 TaxID=2652390 RepID=UPI00127AA692|nr:hypothetical protein [Prolixibacter sp. NT017]GET27746.1 hypothetical protein NT017_40750 [Prolixibacter sp. NT017]